MIRWLSIVIALWASPGLAEAQGGAGTVSGALTVDGVGIPFTHVYAQTFDDVEGARLEWKPAKWIVVQLTDRHLPEGAVTVWYRMSDLARKKGLRAVELEINPAKRELIALHIYYPPQGKDPPNTSITLVGKPDYYRLEELKIEAGQISGKVSMTRPEKFLHFTEGTKPETYQFTATFRTTIRPPEPVTGIITGAKLATSPQMRAAKAFINAIKAGDLAAVRRLASVDLNHRFDEIIAVSDKTKFLEFLRQMAPDPKFTDPKKARLVVRSDRATLVVKRGQSADTMVFVREGGTWKLGAE